MGVRPTSWLPSPSVSGEAALSVFASHSSLLSFLNIGTSELNLMRSLKVFQRDLGVYESEEWVVEGGNPHIGKYGWITISF